MLGRTARSLKTGRNWPTERSRLFNADSAIVSVSPSEEVSISGQSFTTRYEGEKIQRIEKSVFPGNRILLQPNGLGRFIWSPLPLELGDSMPALVAFYKHALTQSGISPVFQASPNSPSVLVLPSLFRDVVLYTFVSETDRDQVIRLTHLETNTRVDVGVAAGRATMIVLDRKSGKNLSTGYRAY